VDSVIIDGVTGLRRLRPSAQIHFADISVSSTYAEQLQPVPIAPEHGDPQSAIDELPFLRQFCTSPLPEFKVIRSERSAHYVLTGDTIGPNSAVNLTVGGLVRNLHPRYQTDPPRRIPGNVSTSVPCKTLVMDTLLHEDIWPNSNPELIFYDTTRLDWVDPNKSTADVHRLDVMETLEFLGKGVARFGIAEVGYYTDLIRFVCDQLGWDADRLRGYRCRVRYPVMGTNACTIFDPPPRPTPQPKNAS
jgi:hypothetical protein